MSRNSRPGIPPHIETISSAELNRLKQLEVRAYEGDGIIANQTLELRCDEKLELKRGGSGPSQRKDAVRALMAEELNARAACRLASYQ